MTNVDVDEDTYGRVKELVESDKIEYPSITNAVNKILKRGVGDAEEQLKKNKK